MVRLYIRVFLLGVLVLNTVETLDGTCKGSQGGRDHDGPQQESQCDSKYSSNPHQQELRIVFVGKTGTGKSSTINTIAGKRLFNATASPSSVTINCQWAQFEVEGKPLLVVDTPGIFDTNTPIPETVEELAKVMTITSPGFHVFIIVMKVGRFTEEEHNSVRILAETFGPELYERAVIVFTGLDDLEADGVSFESFIQSANENLTELFATCSNRIIPFNNRLPLNGDARKPQVRNLMRTIERIMKEKNNSYYTNEVYEAIQKEIEEEIARRLAKKEAERQAEERKEQERMKAQKDLEEEKRKRQMAEEDLEREKQRRQESEERRRKEERDREWQNERMNINQQEESEKDGEYDYDGYSNDFDDDDVYF